MMKQKLVWSLEIDEDFISGVSGHTMTTDEMVQVILALDQDPKDKLGRFLDDYLRSTVLDVLFSRIEQNNEY